MRAALIAVAALMYAACPAPPPSSSGPRPPPGNPGPGNPPPTGGGGGAAGTPCDLPDNCESGICEGQGCDPNTPGVCAPAARSCTRDLREYCGCDGTTFRASGSCPGQRYSAKGACP